MPKRVVKPIITPEAPPSPAPEPVAESNGTPAPDLREVRYTKLEIEERSTTSKKGPLTSALWKKILGWETESEYLARMATENPGTKPEQWMANPKKKDVFGDVYHCKNVAGEKVRCRNNAQNRPFDMSWCDALIHTVLYGQWAGPHTIPGETVNGETVRISRYGELLSGQHEGTACILATERLLEDRRLEVDTQAHPKYPAWAGHDECFIETILIKGMSEDPRVLMTVDYVKPRTAADVFYTSEVFRTSTPGERKEQCRILASAVDTLWSRTDARGYKTHLEMVAFLERHQRLLKCVLHLYTENSADTGRKISKLRLQPGTCAALMFIQASSGPKTDGDDYRNEMPPTEKNLDWSLWDKAEEFWALLAGGKDFQLVRTALASLVDSTPDNEVNQGLGGRGPEKLAILSRAWDRFKDHTSSHPPFDEDDLGPDGALCLVYTDLDSKGNKLPNGEIDLVDIPDFYGIDCPESIGSKPSDRPPAPPPQSNEVIATREEIQAAKEKAHKRQYGGK